MRRYTELKKSAGTRWPPLVAQQIRDRDRYCVGGRSGFPVPCSGAGTEIDHVRASHGMGMKSPSTTANGVLLCNLCHVWKTEHGRQARPLLLAYLERFYGPAVRDDYMDVPVTDPYVLHETHVDPAPGCVLCYRSVRR